MEIYYYVYTREYYIIHAYIVVGKVRTPWFPAAPVKYT